MLTLFLALAFVQTPKIAPVPPKPVPAPVVTGNKMAEIPAPGKTLATVNGEMVKASDLEAYLWDWRGLEALQDVVSYRLILQEAKRAGVTATQKEIDDSVARQLDIIKKSLPKGETVDQALRDQGFPMSRLILRVKSEVLANKIVMKGLKADEYIKVSTMIFRPESPQTPALAAAIRRADDAYDKLLKGTSWDIVMAESDPGERGMNSRGELGWKPISSFPESQRKILETLKIGEMTKPSQTPNGIQLFKLEARGVEAQGKDLEDLKAAYLASNSQIVLKKIREGAKIERFFP